MIKTQHPRQTAQEARRALANAHAAWMATEPEDDEADIALEAALIATGTLHEDDIVESLDVCEHGTSIEIQLADGDVIELDAYGNTMRGEAE